MSQVDCVLMKFRRVWHMSAKVESSHEVVREESLCIQRVTKSVELRKKDGEKEICQRICDQSVLTQLLDMIDGEKLFGDIVGNPTDAVEPISFDDSYNLSVKLADGTVVNYQGSYDKLALPSEWGDFAKLVADYLKGQVSFGYMLDPWTYGYVKRRESDITYCSVYFPGSYGKCYYYISDDPQIDFDDYVWVPVGEENEPKLAEIEDVDYFAPEDVPYPIERTKHILRRATDEEVCGKE